MVFNKITELFSKLKDGAGNLITSTDMGGGKRGLDVNAEFSGNIGAVKIEDADSINKAKVDSSGNLYVITPQPQPPAGKTPISGQLEGNLHHTQDSYTTIPAGEKIVVQKFRAGSEFDKNGGSVFSLYYAPNGDDSSLEIIDVIFTNGNSTPIDLNYETVLGDGTKALLLRFEHLSGGAVRVFTKWEGYY